MPRRERSGRENMNPSRRSWGAASGFPPARNAPATRVVKNVRTNRRPLTNKGFFSFLLRFNYKIKDTEGGDSDRRQIAMLPEGESVLVHICCAPDASYGIPAMSKRFRVSGFFFNPNIWPGQEHDRRLQATRQLQDALPFALPVVGGGEEEGEQATRGMEDEPERGRRCEACIRMRLARTAREAKSHGIPGVSTVLPASPKKDAAMVNRVGREEGEKAGVLFLEADLKKNDGFRKSVEITKRLGIYRQNYCGCRDSLTGGGHSSTYDSI